MRLLWNDKLRTGITVIDDQHQSLFKLIEKLDLSKEDESIFYEVLVAFQRYISVHFESEEEYMKYAEYPDYKHHKRTHDNLIRDFRELLKNKSTDSSIIDSRIEIIEFMENWIEKHYTDEDVKMAEYLNNLQQ